MTAKKRNICIDFDGVLNTYTGWQGEDELFELRDGAADFLEKLHKIYNVIIFTTRNVESVSEWLEKYGVSEFVTDVTNTKLPAVAYIDDRGINFSGNFEDTYKNILEFKPYWQ